MPNPVSLAISDQSTGVPPVKEDISTARRLRVAVSTTVNHAEMDRLCPARLTRWDRCDFLLNPPRGTACDYWIVFAGSREHDLMYCDPANTLFIAGEPPSKKIYPKTFYAQFHRVVSSHATDPHPQVTTSAPGLNWHVGLSRDADCYRYGYDELKQLAPEVKFNKISVVCSNLTTTTGQRQRLALLHHLKHALGDAMVHYGRGFTPIADKMEAILPHRFHLVLENSCSPDYWTEKLSDAYLGWAYPIYAGCQNLGDYFPAAGFTAVDVNQPEQALAIIRDLLTAAPAPDAGAVMAQCRNLILDVYNPFARFAHWAQMFHQPDGRPQPVAITTHKAFRPFPRGLIHRLSTAAIWPRTSSDRGGN